uniref:Gamma-glutamyltranspeptidase 3-like n=1 Tax=Phallusia mammillata TaxID=59560 RepID=A0A6F9DE84_9ASCI|nr:gamma-glutamyltranspeptidase 3-like [Phallusia mammillata]
MNAFGPKTLLKCQKGCVASSQVLATEIGVKILKKGGNAADSAVAVAAALNLLEPCSTGLGGDAFCLFYHKASNTVKGLNASGRSPKSLTLDVVKKMGYNEENKPPVSSPLNITVPGACAGWVDCVEKFGSGKLTLQEILQPAIELAESGFQMTSPITQYHWEEGSYLLSDKKNLHGNELLVKDKSTGEFFPPKLGQTFKNPTFAQVLKSIAKHGKNGFYKGWVADAIVDTVQNMGGFLTHEDLENHKSEFVVPISIEYKGFRLWEIPPNGQGLVALEVLNILKNFNFSEMQHNSAEYLHILAEAIRLSFNDALKYCGDMDFCEPPLNLLLSEDYGQKLAKKIKKDKAMECSEIEQNGTSHGDTVYFTTADTDGNFCSFINSNYMGFGTGIVPKGCGFSLQNRGRNFTLELGHPNALEPCKRPYHTIIPAMLTDASTGEAVMSYGVMGGFMQPQGHVQVLLNMLEYGMNPQQALDAPRLLVGSGHLGAVGKVNLETGISKEVIEALKRLGHDVNGPVTGFKRALYGRGQIIANRQFWKDDATPLNCLWAGSDIRADGKAMGVETFCG